MPELDDENGVLDDEEEDFPDDEIIRAKGAIDGAATLAEAAELARCLAAWLQQLHDDGYVLRQVIEDDYAFYYKPGQAPAVPRDRVCIGCEQAEGQAHLSWCPVVTGTLGSLEGRSGSTGRE